MSEPVADRFTAFMWLTDLVGRGIMRALTRVDIEGLEHLPRSGPLLLAGNHVSNADPPFITCFLAPVLGRPVRWMGKQEALDWPVVGWFLRQNGVFGVRRGTADVEAYRAARRALDAGQVLGIFPEGTRSPTGALRPARDGVALLAVRSGAAVVPIGISGTQRLWPRGARLPRPTPRISMRIGEPMVLRTPGGDRRPDLAPVTAQLMARIAALLPPEMRGVYAEAVARDGGPEPTARIGQTGVP